MAWLYFAVIQLVTLLATVAGWLVLLPFCLLQAWTAPSARSINPSTPGRLVDSWRWQPLNAVYGNPEDGVSGQQAAVWNSTGQLVPYMPTAPACWRAYCWSAWRNSADQLKYCFAWRGNTPAPFVTGTWLAGRTYRAGWQLENGKYLVPVFSV
jgi:hypothetical protein